MHHPDPAQFARQLPVLHASAKADPDSAPDEHPHSGPGRPPYLTPDKQAAFCNSLSHHGNVRLACRALGISSQTAYRARRAYPAMRACWDAALLLAREAVEEVLADRALHGVEEAVYYHGEEVARRRRYDSRLLLAHLARLDARAARQRVCSGCGSPAVDEGNFDAALERLGEGAHFAPGQCSMCSIIADDPAAEAAAEAASEAGEAGESVPPKVPPCPDCGGQCLLLDEDPDARLTQADCMWLGNRLERMHDARPRGALAPHALATRDVTAWDIEVAQLEAFEAGEDEWWLVGALDVDDLDWPYAPERAAERAQEEAPERAPELEQEDCSAAQSA